MEPSSSSEPSAERVKDFLTSWGPELVETIAVGEINCDVSPSGGGKIVVNRRAKMVPPAVIIAAIPPKVAPFTICKQSNNIIKRFF